jgi:predicted membrane protein
MKKKLNNWGTNKLFIVFDNFVLFMYVILDHCQKIKLIIKLIMIMMKKINKKNKKRNIG